MIIAPSIRGPLSRSNVAIAAPIPTPTAGTPTLASPPNPNPVAFPGAPNQTLLSGQYNTNFYTLWNYLANVAAALNGCGYVPGATLSSVSVTYPITATFGACAPGTGANLAVSLAHGDYVDTAAAQTINGSKTFSSAALFPAGIVAGSGAGGGVVVAGGFSGTLPTFGNASDGGANFSVAASSTLGTRHFKYDGSVLTLLSTLDNNGNFSVAGSGTFPALQSLLLGTSVGNGQVNVPGAGALYLTYSSGSGGVYFCNGAAGCPAGVSAAGIVTGSNFQVGASGNILRGTTSTYPFVQGDYNGNEHIVRGTTPSIAPAGNAVITGLAFTSASSYDCALGLQGGTGVIYARNSGAQITIYPATTVSTVVSYVCIGN